MAKDNPLYLDLSITVHNIKGMGSNATVHKLDDLMTLLQDYDIDIVIITETNSDRKKSTFLDITRYNNRYKFYFSDKNMNKNKSIGYGGKNEEPTYTRIDMLWMKGSENIIVNRAYIIPSEECTDSDHDILITRIYMAEFLVNNRRYTRRIAFNQSRIAATTRTVNEGHEKARRPKMKPGVSGLSSTKRQIIDLDKTHKNNIELFHNSDIRADNRDTTEEAIGSQEQLLNIINSCWSQITASIDEAINSHLHTKMSSIHRTKQTNRKSIDYIAAKHTSKLYKLLKDLKRYHGEISDLRYSEEQTICIINAVKYWNIKFPKYNRDYSDLSLITFTDNRNFRITNIDIKDPRCIHILEDNIKTCREMDHLGSLQ
ncbi:hypothetical protein RclHR1_00150056 [Rhizophagus clarus]|uniref:Endonuclease/exonuclease/phosphatase domain-containing protein n=1 Tax=Rhizophagus clarus TaxID=94130 RepID=A0A2Z6QE50_9GLOM|nr:hypothetical protein RclHR1_00150056 [Rhizophagus clarus]